MDGYSLDELDYKILQLIANDARISFLEVARICNVSGAAVHQRVQKMITHEIIAGSEFLLNMQKIGYKVCAYLTLYFPDTENVEDIAEKLKKIPEVVECHIIAGVTDLFVKVYARDNEHLLSIIQQRLKPLGVVKVDSMTSFRESFHRQVSFFQDLDGADAG